MKTIFALCRSELDKSDEEARGIRVTLEILRVEKNPFAEFDISDPEFWIKPILIQRTQAVYTGMESVLERLLKNVDGGLPSGDAYHRELLEAAAVSVPDLRPAIISPELHEKLDELRRFRHVARKRYGAEMQLERIVQNAERAVETVPLFRRSFEAFERRMNE